MAPPLASMEVIDAVYNLARPTPHDLARDFVKEYEAHHQDREYQFTPLDPGQMYNICWALISQRPDSTNSFESLLKRLEWHYDHWAITKWNGMYVGIETDGYTHT
jgi:hypothetical protein